MVTTIRNAGSGPGSRTFDGCSVELWKQLKPGAEPDVIATAVPAGGTILELGAGVGRITHPLLARGYRVVAVDNSPDMLAEIRDAETLLSDIEDVALDRRFDAVLLGSCLIHAPGFDTRRALLATCRRHLGPAGVVLIQRHRETWPGDVGPGFTWEADGVRNIVDAIQWDGPLVHMTLRHETAIGTWTHSFTFEPLDRAGIDEVLAAADLRLEGFLDARETWIAARARSAA
jgi:SAM-dependent methyltransferase